MAQPETSPEVPEVPQRRMWLRVVVTAALVLSAIAIFAVVARRTFLRTEFDLTTLIDDSAGITPSSPVLLHGIDVGHVVRVELSGSPDPDKTVRILMRFPRRILNEIPEDSTAAITSGNLLGDKYIDISRGTHAKHVQPGAQILSSPTQDIGSVLSHANAPLNQVNAVLAHFNKIMGFLDSQEGTLGKLLNNPTFQKHLTTVSGDQAELLKKVNAGQGVLARFDELSAEIQKPIARLNTIQDDLGKGAGSLGKFLHDPYTPTLTAEAKNTADEATHLIADFNAGNRTGELLNRMQRVGDKLDDTLARMNSGQGTLGQFLVNPQLHDSIERVNRELNSLIADFKKHPTRFAQLRVGLF